MPTHPMNTKTLLLFLSLTGILACGPSKSDRLIQEAELRAHDDSVKRAAEDQMKQKLEMKFALTDSINRIGTEVSTLKEALGNLKAELEVQKDKLAGLKDFQFLRSRGERESQIREKARELVNLENLQNETATRLENLLVRLDYFKGKIREYAEN